MTFSEQTDHDFREIERARDLPPDELPYPYDDEEDEEDDDEDIDDPERLP